MLWWIFGANRTVGVGLSACLHGYEGAHCGSWMCIGFLPCIKPVVMCLCRDCRVVKDMATGKSKGYGFVSFFNKWVRIARCLHCRWPEWCCVVCGSGVCTVPLLPGCRERHPADGRTVAGREADQDQLGHKETHPQNYKRRWAQSWSERSLSILYLSSPTVILWLQGIL